MICMYDGNVYAITEAELENLNREDVFLFFENGHKEDIFAVYDADNQYVGAITCCSLVSSPDLSSAVIDEKLVFGKNFWEEAYLLLAGQRHKVVPVFNCDMEMLYLARYERELESVWQKLEFLISLDTQAGLWALPKYHGKYFHLIGCNMVLYSFWYWLKNQCVSVSVSGNQWELFGIQEEECEGEAIFVDEKCEEIEYLYDEFMSELKEGLDKLDKVQAKDFVGEVKAENKIMFWLPPISSIFASHNIMSLILMYLKSRKTCTVIMSSREDLLSRGAHWLGVATEFMQQIQNEGGDICFYNELEKICQGKYSICYIPMIEEVSQIPQAVCERIDIMVAVQPWAFMTHYYRNNDNYNFENDFTDKARNSIDFYVASDFMADWICQQDERWSDKMLRLGYPKQDMLYHYVHEEQDIPQEWLDKTVGKKVFLFTEFKVSWIEKLFEKDQIIILRPHPDYLNLWGERLKQLLLFCEGRIILDDRSSYNASFYLADAMVTEPGCSVGVNFLSLGKPVLFRSDTINEWNLRIDFRQEDWYKAAYIGENDQDIFDFMDMIRRGEDVKKEELEPYRRRMVTDFDGKVCERIYNYFENYNK